MADFVALFAKQLVHYNVGSVEWLVGVQRQAVGVFDVPSHFTVGQEFVAQFL